jgi:hypothetical protein
VPRHRILQEAKDVGAERNRSDEPTLDDQAVLEVPIMKLPAPFRLLTHTVASLAFILLTPLALAEAPAQRTFATPQEAGAALVEAMKADDLPAQRSILGPRAGKLIRSGDAVADESRRARFVAAYAEGNKVALEGDSKATLVVGKDEWSLPIPLVKSDGGWRFDATKGADEILRRRIGRNELAAIQVCLAIVDAQREYVAKDRDRDGILEYAAKFTSTPGKHDGLFWETRGDAKPSPLGPFIAQAAKEGYGKSGSGALAPYHGYYYRLLTKQGKDAKGGETDYFVKGKLIGGFAAVVYPARYGASGVMSFIVNHDGVVYEKDLGRDTATVAAGLTAFNPDESWKAVPSQSPAAPARASK